MRHTVLLMGASVCGIVGYMIYLVFKRDNEEEDPQYKRSNFKTLQLQIPKEKVRILIGRNGKNVKALQIESNTKITFKRDEDEQDETCTCLIRGTAIACTIAHNLIEDFFSKQPVIEIVKLEVPQSCVGRIIGRCGEQITEISVRSGAMVTIEDDRRRPGATAAVVIKGSLEQIEVARSLVEAVVERTVKLESALAKREPRSVKNGTPKTERISLFPGRIDSEFEVYVSAMIDPSHFWVQIVSPKAALLDCLVYDMSDYYESPENRQSHLLKTVQVGDLVAAQFHIDNKWYRAEVLAVQPDGQLELFYLDYGDTDGVQATDVYELRTDFLRLNFQAIECYLSGVEPSNKSGWSEEAMDKFEECVHVAQWKKLAAKMKGYSIREKMRSKREGSPVPGIELHDVSDGTDVDIAEKLVACGYAVYKKDAETLTCNTDADC